MTGTVKTIVTYDLEEANTIIRGPGRDSDWLRRRLIKGVFSGYKAGRQWRMTEQDVRDAIEKQRPKVGVPVVPSVEGMTRTSRRSLARG